jgi:competence protein ComFC
VDEGRKSLHDFPMLPIGKVLNFLAPWKEALLDVVFPRTCRVCDLPLSQRQPDHPLREWFCQPCEEALPKLEAPFCQVCGEPYDGVIETAFRCGNCSDRKFAFEFAISGYQAHDQVRELVHRFKYNRELSLRGALADLLQRALLDPRLAAEDLSRWSLVPVPLHHVRRRDREFNQSWELCRELAKRCGLPAMDAMKRIRATGKQARLTRAQRLENLRGAFTMKRRFRRDDSSLRGRNVLLVDDVFTTGATTHECARILRREGGVEKVVVISVARG